MPPLSSFSVSHTTRAPRPGEVDGVDYAFSSKDSMETSIRAGEFIEYAQVHDNYYGTSRQGVEAVTAKGQGCVLDIDVQGASQVRASGMETVTIFVRPPGKEVGRLEQEWREWARLDSISTHLTVDFPSNC